MSISPLAYIHPDAKIGKNVTIDPFASIYGDVEIGDNTHIASNAIIMDGARIGKNVKIFPTAVISAVPQDLKYQGEPTLAIIGDNTVIREGVTFNKGTTDKNMTKIGKNGLLMAYVHIAHDCIIGDNVIIANSTQLAGHITIDDFAIIEGMAAAQQFTHIGAHSFVGGTSKIRKDVPPFIKVAKEPLSFIGVNTVGLRRRGFSDQIVAQIEDAYRIIYVKNQNITKGLEQMKAEIPDSPEKQLIVQFFENSKNGVVRGLI
ncbi:MAG: acyl-ACP--UDP-N-acetylglucosamine O-acyltransferase [Luteibaculaceae bacterium]